MFFWIFPLLQNKEYRALKGKYYCFSQFNKEVLILLMTCLDISFTCSVWMLQVENTHEDLFDIIACIKFFTIHITIDNFDVSSFLM